MRTLVCVHFYQILWVKGCFSLLPDTLTSALFHSQFFYLPGYYQALLITGMILLTVIEVARLYLGYIGNLREKVIQSSGHSVRFLLWTVE